jgi:hypothetical protein
MRSGIPSFCATGAGQTCVPKEVNVPEQPQVGQVACKVSGGSGAVPAIMFNRILTKMDFLSLSLIIKEFWPKKPSNLL